MDDGWGVGEPAAEGLDVSTAGKLVGVFPLGDIGVKGLGVRSFVIAPPMGHSGSDSIGVNIGHPPITAPASTCLR